MPDDNSCLFRAFGTAVLPGDDLSMTELRALVASRIQAEPEVFTQVVLEQKPDDYCRWIQTEDAWGGAIEMGILAQHFDIEICSIDVQVFTHSTHFLIYPLTINSLYEPIDLTKAARTAVYFATPVSTMTRLFKVLPTHLILRRISHRNLTNEYGRLTMTRL